MDDILLYNRAFPPRRSRRWRRSLPPNSAPVLDPVGDKTATAGSELAFTATASDPDAGDTLTFTLANGTSGTVPAGASITAGGAFTWTPNTTQIGTAHLRRVRLRRRALRLRDDRRDRVARPTAAPVLTRWATRPPPPAPSSPSRRPPRDPDAGDTLTFTLANGTSGTVPAGASITSGGAFTWTPNTTQVGTAHLRRVRLRRRALRLRDDRRGRVRGQRRPRPRPGGRQDRHRRHRARLHGDRYAIPTRATR